MANASDSSFPKASKMAFKHPKQGSHLSDESMLRRQILQTHEFDERWFDVKPVLSVIDEIFSLGTSDFRQGLQSQMDLLEISKISGDVMLDLPRVTSEISCEILCNFWFERDTHATTMNILHILKHYNWDAKVVLAVSALALSFGGFRLVLQLHPTNPLAKAVTLLKQFPELLDFAGTLKPNIEAFYGLIKAIMDMIKGIVELYELSHNAYFTAETPEIVAATAQIPITVYWTIWSTVVCASQTMGLSGMGSMYLLESWELASLSHKLKTLRGHLAEKINDCYKFIEKKKEDEAVYEIARILESPHIDNSKALKILFDEKGGHQQALHDCLRHKKLDLEDLSRKVVGLFITDLDIVYEDYFILHQMFLEKLNDQTRIESQYEIIWVPVVDSWTEEKFQRFESHRDEMEWYTLNHPSVVSRVIIRCIKEMWNFEKNPILVVMDTQGQIVHKDATQMICMWGTHAYPFSLDREILLWSQASWNMTLLADEIDLNLPSWIEEGKHICLYGGEDIDWIRKFTKTAQHVAQESGIALEMLYVGKNRAKDRVMKKIVHIIQREKLSGALKLKVIMYFWLRMEKLQTYKPPVSMTESLKPEFFALDDPVLAATTYNPIFRGILNILSFSSSCKGWAVISDGSGNALFEADGEALLKALAEHDKWKKRENYGFLTALELYYHELCNDLPHCIKMTVPETDVEKMYCAVCNKSMEKMVLFSCCLDKASYELSFD